MTHVERLGGQIHITLPRDEGGFVGRECPAPACLRYFKIVPGTGLPVSETYCPYCGVHEHARRFFTPDQITYARSVVKGQVVDAVQKDLEPIVRSLDRSLKKLDDSMSNVLYSLTGRRVHRPMRAAATLEMKRESVRGYRELELETEVQCDRCTLRYAIYGVFGFCPDCGVHNSEQMLQKNLDISLKLLDMAEGVQSDSEVRARLLENALEDAVSAFDGFGREVCRGAEAIALGVGNMSFQNLYAAREKLQKILGYDLAAGVTPEEWLSTLCGFQKRHLLAHSMGVIDERYVQNASDPGAVVGRKAQIQPDEVRTLASVLRRIGSSLVTRITGTGSPPPGP